MSWLEDELREQQEQEAERQRQAAERQQQEQEAAWRREQEERPLLNQRQQQLEQMARQQLEPILSSLQLLQLLQDAKNCIRSRRRYATSLEEGSLHVDGNISEINESLHITVWKYSVWLLALSRPHVPQPVKNVNDEGDR